MARLIVSILLVGLLALACAAPQEPLPSTPAGVIPTEQPMSDGVLRETAATPRLQAAVVTRIIDGDTIEVQMNGESFKVRYIGIDTPETVAPNRPVECFGPQATGRNGELVSGRQVELEKDVSERDDFDRLLRYVYVDGRMVNELLVAEGFAQVSTFPPDVKYVDRFLEAQRRASEKALGLWRACAAGQATLTAEPPVPPPTGAPGQGAASVVVDPSCSQFDSPGNDNQTASEEFVCFRNAGGAVATMTGWSVADFDARHVYTFPLFSLPPGTAVRLRSGCGANAEYDLYWCADGAVWNNAGDTVKLRDASRAEVASYSYGVPE